MTTTTTDLPSPLAILDVETDGLHPGRRIWEYAVIRRDPTRAVDGTVTWTETEHHSFVELDLRFSDPKGLEIGGFWERHPEGRRMVALTAAGSPTAHVRTASSAARHLLRLTAGTHMVGVNPSFDAATLERLLRAEHLPPLWHYHLVDLVAMTAGYLAHGWGGSAATPPWRSDQLSAAVNVEPPAQSRHTALGDARWAARWWDRLTDHATAPQIADETAEDVA